MNNKCRLGVVIAALATAVFAHVAYSQSSYLNARLYQNQYLSNPAFAGMEEGLFLNLAMRNQWRNIPGSPVFNSLTGDYKIRKVGTGLNISSMKAGLISRTRVVGTYAYHLPLNRADQMMHFGLSLGVMMDRLDNDRIISHDPDDPTAAEFNMRSTYLDGDFGMAYTTDRLTIQGAIPNLKLLLKKDERSTVEESTVYAALSYKIGQSLETLSIEPKLCYRGASGLSPVFDLGANVNFLDNKLVFMAVFHSSKASSLGFGLRYDKFDFQGCYTGHIAAQREQTGGSFEVSLRMHLFKEENTMNRNL